MMIEEGIRVYVKICRNIMQVLDAGGGTMLSIDRI